MLSLLVYGVLFLKNLEAFISGKRGVKFLFRDRFLLTWDCITLFDLVHSFGETAKEGDLIRTGVKLVIFCGV